jgi:ubiquinone/menaquinone biosynthesis C-methylase UbiE
MTQDAVLDHWNQRASLATRAGSDDTLAKELEIEALSQHIRDGMVVAEFGCGNATTALELLKRHDIELYCFDFSPAMIEQARKVVRDAGMEARIHLMVCDVRNEPAIGKKFDLVYTERMIINLPDWATQAGAIRYLLGHVKPGGQYLMCENSAPGLDYLNKLRLLAGLQAITPPWHNVYLVDELVASMEIPGARLVDVELFSSTYYFLSRVVNAWLAAREGVQPSYDAPVNQLALLLPPFGDCAQGRLWVFEKTNADS